MDWAAWHWLSVASCGQVSPGGLRSRIMLPRTLRLGSCAVGLTISPRRGEWIARPRTVFACLDPTHLDENAVVLWVCLGLWEVELSGKNYMRGRGEVDGDGEHLFSIRLDQWMVPRPESKIPIQSHYLHNYLVSSFLLFYYPSLSTAPHTSISIAAFQVERLALSHHCPLQFSRF